VIRPRRLQLGDRIALVAPASAFKPADLETGVAELQRLGFEPVYDPAILERARFEAGTPATRAKVLHDAWNDPSIAALLAVRGGYGSQQLLPLLEPEVMRGARKLLIGYSDITTLLLWSFAHGVVSIHGPMIEGRLSVGSSAYDEPSFVNAVTVAEPMGVLSPDGLEALAPGEAEGPLVAATLTQLAALLGTPWAFEMPRGSVLCLEDVGERPYRIHRLLTQLAQSGVMERAGALVFGEFPGCDEPGGCPGVREVLHEFVQGFPGPVLFGFPFGHTTGPSWTLPVGVRARVTSHPAAIVIEEPAVT
jgi:muramoyltetrapeptide carboxypeptidase